MENTNTNTNATTPIQSKLISTTFHYNNHFSDSVYYQPLYYLASHLKNKLLESLETPTPTPTSTTTTTSTPTKKNQYDTKLSFPLETYNTINLEFSSIRLNNNDFLPLSEIDNNKFNISYILNRCNLDYDFIYDGATFSIKVDTVIDKMPIKYSHDSFTFYTTYKIIYNITDIHKFETFIKSSLKYYNKYYDEMKIGDDKIKLYISSSEGGYFENLGCRTKRPLSTIYLPSKQKKYIIDDLTHFLKPTTKARYQKLGINYKRIYLFEGVPGAGKSSFIMALASHFNYNIAIISFTPKMTDTDLLKLVRRSLEDNEEDRECRKQKFIIFEDLDCIFRERKTNDENRNLITFSGLLNALDGITTGENLICFITTNYKQHLDSALIRPGRVDYIMHFDHLCKEQIVDVFKVYTCDQLEENKTNDVSDSINAINATNATNAINATNDTEINQTIKLEKQQLESKTQKFYEGLMSLNIKVSMSLLQQYLLKYLDKPDDAIENLDELKTMYDACNISKEASETGLYN